MPLVQISEERRRFEAARAARAEEETERRERREARLAAGVMVGSILLQYLVAGLAMHMTGDEAQAFYLIAMLLGPLPLTIAVIAGSRKD